MAVTSIWPHSNVEIAILYITNPEKVSSKEWERLHISSVGTLTENRADSEGVDYISGCNCIADTPEEAINEFRANKAMHSKEDGRQCYHAYQSFKGQEVDAKTAHLIGQDLAEMMWGASGYQVVIATHVNGRNIHNHFVINSVSALDGKKFVNTKADYARFRELSDKLCKEHGLSVIEEPSIYGSKKWKKEHAGQPLVRRQICRDIDAAIKNAKTIGEAWNYLYELGYDINFDKKYPRISPPGALRENGERRYFRFHNLCDRPGYDIDDIEKRILDPEYELFCSRANKKEEKNEPKRYKLKRTRDSYYKYNRLKHKSRGRLYYRILRYKRIYDSFNINRSPIRCTLTSELRATMHTIDFYAQVLNFCSDKTVNNFDSLKVKFDAIEEDIHTVERRIHALESKISRDSNKGIVNQELIATRDNLREQLSISKKTLKKSKKVITIANDLMTANEIVNKERQEEREYESRD